MRTLTTITTPPVTSEESLIAFTITQLTAEYNHLTGANLKKFSTKEEAARRVWAILPEFVSVATTVKPSTTNKITMTTTLTLNTDCPIIKTPQIMKIYEILAAHNNSMTKQEIIHELDKQGYKQPGIKIFAWYQREMLEKGIFTIA